MMIKENFVNYIETSIKRNWNVAAFSNYRQKTYTYSDVAAEIIKLHCFFEQFGLKKGDKVAVIGKNSVNWAITYLAAVSYGAVIVPLLADFPPRDIHHLINHSDSTLLYVSDSIYKTIDSAEMKNLKGIFSLTDFSLQCEHKGSVSKALKKSERLYEKRSKEMLSPEKFRLKPVSNDELLGIIYTSGTSGFSKGVMLSHNNIAANVRFALKSMNLEPGSPILSFLPLAHAYGCAFDFLYPFALGCHIVFLSKIPSPKIIVQAFKEVQPRLIFSVPLILEKIYKKQIKPGLNKTSIKVLMKIPFLKNKVYKEVYNKLRSAFGGKFEQIVIGGAALNKEVETFLRNIRFPYTVGYGMTECGPLISYEYWEDTKPYTAGRVMDTLQIKVDSPNQEKEVGELMVRGENVMMGYYKNKKATAETITPDGWLHTGDLGTIDKKGFIHIKGRSKSIILGPSGQNIYPEEIEAKLNNIPFVSESLVVEREGKLHALIHPDDDALKVEGVARETFTKIVLHAQKNLNSEMPSYMAIASFDIVDKEFEKTPKKSIKRFLYTVPNYFIHRIKE